MLYWMEAHPYLFFVGCVAWFGVVAVACGALAMAADVDERTARWAAREDEGRTPCPR